MENLWGIGIYYRKYKYFSRNSSSELTNRRPIRITTQTPHTLGGGLFIDLNRSASRDGL